MPRMVENSNINASVYDIVNIIRENLPYEYQTNIAEARTLDDLYTLGESLYGHPALANMFMNALVNRIALVRINSATFNNPYAMLKKGVIDYGETIEEIFVGLTKPISYNPDATNAREFKRYKNNVKSVFHICNWHVLYPVTVDKKELRQAFRSEQGLVDLIEKMVKQIYTSAEYDEFLLFKYLLITKVATMARIASGEDLKEDVAVLRGLSNKLTFMSNKYNTAGVQTVTPRERQIVFMDAEMNARYDVDVLASAFNMDKADFMGRLFLIDDWTTFDNDRFSEIMRNIGEEGGEPLPLVAPEQLSAMNDVHAIVVDSDWFQVYDNVADMAEVQSASGLYWNYFYHTWKTFAVSPFANAVVMGGDETIAESINLVLRSENNALAGEGLMFVFDMPEGAKMLYSEGEIINDRDVAIAENGTVYVPNAFNQDVGGMDLKVSYKGYIYELDYNMSDGATFSFDKAIGAIFTLPRTGRA